MLVSYMYQVKPNVLMFGWELPPHNSGGLGVACYGLAKGLSKDGVKIKFALPRRLSVKVPFMEILDHELQGSEVTAIDSMLKAYIDERRYAEMMENGFSENLMMYGKDLYEEAIRFGEMASYWSKYKQHDVIHSHDWMTYPAGLKARSVSGKPFVAHIHATEYDRTGGSVNTMIAELEYQGLNKADRVIAVSEYTKNMVNRYYGVENEKITVVHNGVDFEDFEPVVLRKMFPNDKIVLFVGRLTYQKGVEYFIKAAKEVLVQRPDTVFLVVGDGDMYGKLVMDTAALGIGHRVVFTGFQTGIKLRTCYEMADAFVMPSVSEPYGIVALESIVSGTPTIISRQSGVSEALKNVLKVDFWDSHKMAEHILNVLNFPIMAQEMATQAKREVAKLSWNEAARKTLRVYQDLI